MGSSDLDVLLDVEVGFASTLLGAMVFLMSLTYLTNNSDKDIRRYTYEVISQTIAIFCAVMIFQYINDLTVKFIAYFGWESVGFLVHGLQMLVWYAALQFHLYYISFQGAIVLAKHKLEKVQVHEQLPSERLSVWTALLSLFGREHISFSELHPLDHIEDLQSQMTCWKVLLSHIAGFAAINAFGTLQQAAPFRGNWAMASVVVGLAAITMLVIQSYFSEERRRVAEDWKTFASVYDDRMEDVYEECYIMWREEAEEPEDNVLALTLSFLSVQVIRFWISGTLPDVEGLESWEMQTTRPPVDVETLFLAGAVLCILTVVLDMIAGYQLDPDDEEGSEEPRAVQVMLASCNQAFAWCMYFGCKWMLATREFQDASEDKMLLQLELATLVSLLAFFAIWVLDKLADLDATGDEVDHAIIQVIGGFSILVGFAWEQCFDRAIEVIAADQQRYNLVPPMITKLVLAAACICIIIPAWRKWILPMVLREGWRFGFVIDGSDARWRKVFKSKRWHWLMHRYGIQTVGFKKPSMKEAAMKREKNPGHAFQKRRNEKGLFKILQRERILQIGCDEENMLSPNARTGNRPTLMYGNGGLASPLLQKNHPELGAVKEAISALKKQLQQLSEEERCDATHYRQQMGSLSEEIAKLSTWTAELGLGL